MILHMSYFSYDRSQGPPVLVRANFGPIGPPKGRNSSPNLENWKIHEHQPLVDDFFLSKIWNISGNGECQWMSCWIWAHKSQCSCLSTLGTKMKWTKIDSSWKQKLQHFETAPQISCFMENLFLLMARITNTFWPIYSSARCTSYFTFWVLQVLR